MRVTHTPRETPEQILGAWVREARKQMGWSQETLARRLKETAGIELAQSAIARLESGERPIRLNEASELSKILNLDLSLFSTGAGTKGFLSWEDVQKAEEALSSMAQQEAELRDQLRQLHERHDEEVGLVQAQLRVAAAESLRLRMAIAEWAKKDQDGQR